MKTILRRFLVAYLLDIIIPILILCFEGWQSPVHYVSIFMFLISTIYLLISTLIYICLRAFSLRIGMIEISIILLIFLTVIFRDNIIFFIPIYIVECLFPLKEKKDSA